MSSPPGPMPWGIGKDPLLIIISIVSVTPIIFYVNYYPPIVTPNILPTT